MLVVFNDSHPPRRIRATLMEEFFHLWLGHKPTRLRVFVNGDASRDFDGAKESEAYGSGAAALVPYKPLRKMLEQGRSVRSIADHYLVSEQLVDFRIKISKLSRFRKG
jgi:Zn-dependent peptidase ImmA (M78 family)